MANPETLLPPWSTCKVIRHHFYESAPPFIAIGAAIGILHYIFVTASLPPLVAHFLDLIEKSFPIRKDLLDVLSEHAAPKTMAYGLLSTAALVFLGRTCLGTSSRIATWYSERLIFPLFRFNLTLSIAMSGMILGLAVPALVTGYAGVALLFVAFTLYPVTYVVLMAMCVRLAFPQSHLDDDPFISRARGVIALLIFADVLLTWPYIERVLAWTSGLLRRSF